MVARIAVIPNVPIVSIDPEVRAATGGMSVGHKAIVKDYLAQISTVHVDEDAVAGQENADVSSPGAMQLPVDEIGDVIAAAIEEELHGWSFLLKTHDPVKELDRALHALLDYLKLCEAVNSRLSMSICVQGRKHIHDVVDVIRHESHQFWSFLAATRQTKVDLTRILNSYPLPAQRKLGVNDH